MRDINYGWLIRYLHANGAAFFFLFVYAHIGKGLYYGSYRTPRALLWSIGVAIFLIMVITAFLGYLNSLKWNSDINVVFQPIMQLFSLPVIMSERLKKSFM
jgi:ubiquinol-cytochrome c reductase cytochrome b subunit